jgi:hypothetical protein
MASKQKKYMLVDLMKRKSLVRRTKNLITLAQNNQSMPLDLDDDIPTIIMRIFVGKKARMIFYTRREILLFSNGNIAYKRKSNPDVIKRTIQPKDIYKMSRTKNILTIITNSKAADTADTESQFIFKFED